MKYLLLTIVLSIFSVTVSAKCADGYLCKDFLGNTYYNQNGMKHLTERNQRTVGLLSTIAKPPQNNIFANIQQLQQVQEIKRFQKTQGTEQELTLEDIELAKRRIAEYELKIVELGKKYPEIQQLIDINTNE